MQSEEIPDTAITASSNAGKFFQPHLARVDSIEHSGWCAGLKNTRQYLIVDLGKVADWFALNHPFYISKRDQI